MATIIDGKKRIPFMRGMLMHYLIQRGFTHEEAHGVANATREALSKEKDVRKKELIGLVERLVREDYGKREVGDLIFWERLPTSITVERTNGARPFSKELLSRSIQASGLAPDQAYKIAQTIESHLIDQRRQRITHEELETQTVDLLKQYHNQSYAERYRVWRVWGELDRPLVILIGGASGVGKTSLAVSLANLLDIPRVVATDDIRQVMRLMLSPELMPALHPSSYTARAAVSESSATGEDPVISGFREQARIISVGVQAIMSRCIEENTSVIIDGVHLLPDFLDMATYSKFAFVMPICLTLSDSQAYKERFAERASSAPARPEHKYLSHLEEILKIQEHILERCDAHDIPVLGTHSIDDVTSAAVMMVGERLQDQAEIQKVLGNGQKAKRKRKN